MKIIMQHVQKMVWEYVILQGKNKKQTTKTDFVTDSDNTMTYTEVIIQSHSCFKLDEDEPYWLKFSFGVRAVKVKFKSVSKTLHS